MGDRISPEKIFKLLLSQKPQNEGCFAVGKGCYKILWECLHHVSRVLTNLCFFLLAAPTERLSFIDFKDFQRPRSFTTEVIHSSDQRLLKLLEITYQLMHPCWNQLQNCFILEMPELLSHTGHHSC